MRAHFVPASVDDATATVIGWPGIEAAIKTFCYNDALPDTSNRVISEATTTLKISGVMRGPSDKGVYFYQGAEGKVGKYTPREQDAVGPTLPDCLTQTTLLMSVT
jgi:hypothetical protein